VTHRRLALLLLLFGLAPAGLPAQAPAAAPVPLAAVPAAPAPVQRTLLNDLNTILLPARTGEFVLHLVIADGSVFDPPGKEGAALLTGRLLASLFESKVQALWTGLPASEPPPAISVSTGHDGVHLTVTGHAAALPAAGQCLAETLSRPEFPLDLFQKIKDQAALEGLQVEDQPETVALQEWLYLVFAPFPYAGTPAGTPLSVGAIEPADIVRFVRRNVLPNRSLLAVSAPLTVPEFRRFTSQYFGTWVKGEPLPYEFSKPAPAKTARTLLVSLPQADRSCLVIGGEGFRMKHEDYLASRLAMRLLQVKLDQLAARRTDYRFRSISEGRMLGGYLIVQAVGPAEPDPAVLGEIQEAIAAVAAGRFTREEFAQQQQALVREYGARLAQPEERLKLIVESEWYRLGTRYFEKLPQRTEDIIREDIQFVAGESLAPARVKAVVVSPRAPEAARLPVALQPAAAKTWGQDAPPAQ
jgi:predicted Zn-dependent peptidase